MVILILSCIRIQTGWNLNGWHLIALDILKITAGCFYFKCISHSTWLLFVFRKERVISRSLNHFSLLVNSRSKLGPKQNPLQTWTVKSGSLRGCCVPVTHLEMLLTRYSWSVYKRLFIVNKPAIRGQVLHWQMNIGTRKSYMIWKINKLRGP